MDRDRELLAEFPDTWSCVVMLRRESPDWGEGILVVDARGLTLLELPALETFFSWQDIADVRAVLQGQSNNYLIHVTGRDGDVKLRFGAVETSTQELTADQLWDLASQIRALRPTTRID